MSKKYGLILRISKEDEEKKRKDPEYIGKKINVQRSKLMDYIREKGDGNFVKEYYFKVTSATINDDKLEIFWDKKERKIGKLYDFSKRPEIEQALYDAENKIIDTLIFVRVDRFSRDIDFYRTLTEQFRRFGTEALSITEENHPLLIGIKLLIAKEETGKFKERIGDQKEDKFRLGLHPAKAPFGYRTIEKAFDGEKYKVLEIDEKRAEIVRNAFKMEVGEFIKLYPELHSQTYYNIKKNKRIYQGYISYQGIERLGIHKKIIE